MKSHANRSADYAHVLQTLITSAKLLQDATESSVQPIASGPLLEVAIDRLETLKTLKANRDVGEELADKIVYQISTIFHELSRPIAGEDMLLTLTESVARYTTALTEAHDALTRLTQRGMLGKSIMRGRDRRELQGLTTAMDSEFNSFMEIIGKQPSTRRDHRKSLHINSAASPDVSGSTRRPSSPSPSRHTSAPSRQAKCWPGTRTTILEEINLWATGSALSNSASTNTSSIYWLVDVPGSGKSAISGDLADEWREKGILGGYHEVSSSVTDHEDVDGVEPLCQIWAEQLGSAFPELTPLIIRALSEVHRLPASSKGFQQQFKTLILQPLKQVQRENHGLSPQMKIIFVLDSFDEYSPTIRAPIIQTLKTVNPAHGVKFLLASKLPTSEEDVDMMSELLDAPPSLVTRGNINIHSASNMADILLYLTAQFQIHSAQFHSHPQFRAALIEPTIKVLAKRSEGSMLWTRLAFEMLLAAINPTKDLLNLLEEDSLTEVNGLYLELVLQAQSKLDRINDVFAKEMQQEKVLGVVDEAEVPSSSLSLPGPSQSSQLSPTMQPTYPKNALTMILSAIGFAKESLSIWTLAELTGFGLQRTITLLRLLNTVIDSGEPPTSAPSQVPPLPPLPEARARSSSRLTSPSSFHPMPLKKRSLSNTRDPSVTSSRRKTSQAEMPPARLSNASPTAAGFPPIERSIGNAPSVRSRSREKGMSLDIPRSVAVASFPSTGSARSTLIKIRHSTFRDWIRLRHPPTLLSCLTGRNVLEEDDLRFVVAPSKEGGHATLAKGCLAIIRGSTFTVDDGAESSVDERARSAQGHDHDGGVGDVTYACRYWAVHCAELLDSLDSTGPGLFLSSISNTGSRWKSLRNDMLEFFTRRLLWWADVVTAQRWISEAMKGLEVLQSALQRTSPEEDFKPAVEQLIQWINESKWLLERHQEISIAVLEEEQNPDTSLVWKFYGDELVRRAALLQMRAQEAKQYSASEDMDDEPLYPPPAVFDNSTPMSSPSRKSFSSRGKSPKAASSSHAVANSISTDKAASISTKATSPPQSEVHKEDDSGLDKQLPDVPTPNALDQDITPVAEVDNLLVDEHLASKEQIVQIVSKPLPPSPILSPHPNPDDDPTPMESPTPAISPDANHKTQATAAVIHSPVLITSNIATVSPPDSTSGSPTISNFPNTSTNSPTHNNAPLFPALAMYSSRFANAPADRKRKYSDKPSVEVKRQTSLPIGDPQSMNGETIEPRSPEVIKEPTVEVEQTILNEAADDLPASIIDEATTEYNPLAVVEGITPDATALPSGSATPIDEEVTPLGVDHVTEEPKPLPSLPSLPTSPLASPTRQPPPPPSNPAPEPRNASSSKEERHSMTHEVPAREEPTQDTSALPSDASPGMDDKVASAKSADLPPPPEKEFQEVSPSAAHIIDPPIALSPTETPVVVLPVVPPKDVTKSTPAVVPPKTPSKQREGSSRSRPKTAPITTVPVSSRSAPKPSTSKYSPSSTAYGSPVNKNTSSLFPSLTLFSTNFGRNQGQTGTKVPAPAPSPIAPTSPYKNTSTAHPHSTKAKQPSPSNTEVPPPPTKAELAPKQCIPSGSGGESSPAEHDSTVVDMMALINFDNSESPSLDLGVQDTQK